MSVAEFEALRDSIENIGVKNAITIYDGMVLDGWNRYRAAQELGLPCPEASLSAGDDPRDFVLAQNKARRHITQAQLAMAVTAVHAWRPLGDQRTATVDTECPPSKTTAELAQIAGVHANTIKQAKEVQTRAAPEVQEAVKRGEIGLAKASAISKMPAEQQADAIKAPLSKPAKHQGKPKKVPAVKLVNAEIKAAQAQQEANEVKERVQRLEEEGAALREQLAAAQDDANTLAAVVGEDDQLAAALAEVAKYRTLANGLQARVNSMLSEIAELTASVNFWKKKAGA